MKQSSVGVIGFRDEYEFIWLFFFGNFTRSLGKSM